MLTSERRGGENKLKRKKQKHEKTFVCTVILHTSWFYLRCFPFHLFIYNFGGILCESKGGGTENHGTDKLRGKSTRKVEMEWRVETLNEYKHKKNQIVQL